jgi:hypothetical protein
LVGEAFNPDRADADALRRSLLAAFIRSVDLQSRKLRLAVRATLSGGVTTLAVWGWILAAKMLA